MINLKQFNCTRVHNSNLIKTMHLNKQYFNNIKLTFNTKVILIIYRENLILLYLCSLALW